MIARQTVFVLGAGASMPYGFPSGDQLVDEIVQLALERPISRTFNDAGFKNEQVRRFGEDLASSDAPSIDAFLEYRPEFLDICKLAIAMRLTRKEDDGTLTQAYRKEFGNAVGGLMWYHYLWKEMVAGKGHFGDNKVAFVTFIRSIP